MLFSFWIWQKHTLALSGGAPRQANSSFFRIAWLIFAGKGKNCGSFKLSVLYATCVYWRHMTFRVGGVAGTLRRARLIKRRVWFIILSANEHDTRKKISNMIQIIMIIIMGYYDQCQPTKIIHVLANNLNILVNVVGAIFMYVCWTKLIMKAQFHWIPFHTKLSPHVWIQCEFCAMYELVCLTLPTISCKLQGMRCKPYEHTAIESKTFNQTLCWQAKWGYYHPKKRK